ncbi:hypothetical protein DE146DRAFT_777507 [Phaeosphaeria sp. MPI-PUGE-AT-0046c]|nr:hypothetical protein DE146DRAFT_777507 [Phaeosphaeria sp. MPI-PUGE-AT-0046c]
MATLPTFADIVKWPPPNYDNPVTRRPLVLGVEIPLTVLTIVFVAARFYSRTVIVKAIGWDDWFMLIALIFSTGTNVMTCVSTLPAFQTGYHLYDLRPEILANPYQSAQMAMACQLIHKGIFPGKVNKWFCHSLIVFEIVWAIASFFLTLFQCKPIQSYWLIQSPVRDCLDVSTLYYTTSCLNILTDFIIFLWPAKDLASVQISLRQRITLITMFCLGVIICIAGVCRVWYISIYIKSWDFLWHGTVLFVIISIELSIGIICGCLPGCKPLFGKLFPSIFARSTNATDSYALSDRKNQKKHQFPPKKSADGQSFPFHIVKEEGFEVSFGAESKMGSSSMSRGVERRKSEDEDELSLDSREWNMMQRGPRVAESQV